MRTASQHHRIYIQFTYIYTFHIHDTYLNPIMDIYSNAQNPHNTPSLHQPASCLVRVQSHRAVSASLVLPMWLLQRSFCFLSVACARIGLGGRRRGRFQRSSVGRGDRNLLVVISIMNGMVCFVVCKKGRQNLPGGLAYN